MCSEKFTILIYEIKNKNDTKMSKIYLIDGMSMIFRAYHAMYRSNLATPAGEPIGAVFGFSNILTSLLEKENPENLAVVFDTHAPTFRHEKYEDYKATRDAFPEDLVPQVEKIKNLLDLLGVPRIEKDGYEADDIIGAMAKRASEKSWQVFCITSDKDYYQLVDDNIKILKPGKGGDFEIIDYEQVGEKFGVLPDRVIDVLALIGDSVDNVPGVKGIGEKTAPGLIKEFGSLEQLYENLDKIEKKRIRTNLENDRENAFLSKELVTIDTEFDTGLTFDACMLKKPDYENLDTFFAEAGFNTIRVKWRQKARDAGMQIDGESEKNDNGEAVTAEEIAGESAPAFENINDVEKKYSMPANEKELDEIIEKLKKSDLISFDLETDSLDRYNMEIVGIALSIKEGEAFYIPVENFSGGSKFAENLFDKIKENDRPRWESSFPIDSVLAKLKPVLEDVKIGKCGQNIKFDIYIMKQLGINVTPVVFDSMVAQYILDPDQKQSLDALCKQWLNYEPVPISTLIGEKRGSQKSMAEIDPAIIKDYACEDADLALKLRNVMAPELKKENLDELANDIEFPAIEVLNRMESYGVALDTEALKELSQQITGEIEVLTEKIFSEAGTEFNINSTKQLGHVLFEKLMIPPVKKTKTGYSTNEQVLNELSATYLIANYVLDYRQLVKLQNTYVDALPKMINPKTGRIHTTYNQTVAATGRLSSTDPNLQNIPIRTELGKKVRKAFVSGSDDFVILSADYSQIELRIMAHICDDDHMVEGFKEGRDIHAATAAILNNIDISEVTQDMRRIAKTVNFGIMYGLGAYGLSQRMGLGRKESKEIIDNYFEKYPGIRKYMDMTIEQCREKGYAETLCGRRRYFRDINSKNHTLRTAAERGAINMPIQGTASDMMKIAMIAVDREIRKLGMKSRMLLQVHDELVFEAAKDELDELRTMVKEKMEGALSLGKVPVLVESGYADNWFDAH
jgi:DNA polymerase-1